MNNRFSIIAPSFNVSATARQAILSIAAQSYQNWHLYVIDDCSTDNSESVVKSLFSSLQIEDKLTYVKNTSKKWEVENTLIGLSMCKDDDIIVRIDLDDYCLMTATFEILNKVYQDPSLEAVWTAHLWFSDKTGITNTNISGPLPDDADPYVHPWVSSHLKTWRKYVLNGVNDLNYRGKDGEYARRAGDQFFYVPVLKLAKKRAFLPITAYAYRCNQSPETFQSIDAKFQYDEAQYLRNRGFIK